MNVEYGINNLGLGMWNMKWRIWDLECGMMCAGIGIGDLGALAFGIWNTGFGTWNVNMEWGSWDSDEGSNVCMHTAQCALSNVRHARVNTVPKKRCGLAGHWTVGHVILYQKLKISKKWKRTSISFCQNQFQEAFKLLSLTFYRKINFGLVKMHFFNCMFSAFRH